MRGILAVAAAAFAFAAQASDVGQIKTVRGLVQVEREGKLIEAQPGMAVRQSDTLRTGADGAVGVTFIDESRIALGPRSVLAIERYRFDTTTQEGEFDAALTKGSMATVSGRIVKESPGAMRVRTPASIMGVRGTRFLVRVEAEDQ